MTEQEIQNRLQFMYDRLAVVTKPADIAACNATIEKLVMMEPTQEGQVNEA